MGLIVNTLFSLYIMKTDLVYDANFSAEHIIISKEDCCFIAGKLKKINAIYTLRGNNVFFNLSVYNKRISCPVIKGNNDGYYLEINWNSLQWGLKEFQWLVWQWLTEVLFSIIFQHYSENPSFGSFDVYHYHPYSRISTCGTFPNLYSQMVWQLTLWSFSMVQRNFRTQV